MTRQYGDIVRMSFFIWPAYLVNRPDGVKHILQENQRNYSKDIYPYKIFKPLLGQVLVTNSGDSWLHQRHLMQPAFHRKRLAALGTLMTGAAVAMLDRWQDFAERNQPLDVAAELLRITLCVVGKALFNIDLSDEAHSDSPAKTPDNRLLSTYLYDPFLPLNNPTPPYPPLQHTR